MAFPKYAIFEFDDKSIEIGETQWISDLEESGTSLAGFPYEEKFEVFWPKNSAIIVAKGSKGKVNPPPPKDVKLLDAVILAFNGMVFQLCHLHMLCLVMPNRASNKLCLYCNPIFQNSLN